MERLLADNDPWGFYKRLRSTVGLEGRKAGSEQLIMDKNGTLLRDKVRIRERGAVLSNNFLKMKSSKRDPAISALSPRRSHHRLEMDEPWEK